MCECVLCCGENVLNYRQIFYIKMDYAHEKVSILFSNEFLCVFFFIQPTKYDTFRLEWVGVFSRWSVTDDEKQKKKISYIFWNLWYTVHFFFVKTTNKRETIRRWLTDSMFIYLHFFFHNLNTMVRIVIFGLVQTQTESVAFSLQMARI